MASAQIKFTATPRQLVTQYFKVVDESQVGSAVVAARSPAWHPGLDESKESVVAAKSNNEPTSNDQLFPAATTSSGKALPTSGFDGLGADWTYFVGRPDQSIASGPGGILQMINGGRIALYDRGGHLHRGWPKDAGEFLGLPLSSPCVDHRAIYDLWSQRYWVLTGCQGPLVYVAVSQSSNPNGRWYVYGFDASLSSQVLWDFTMVGVDRNSIVYSTNLNTSTGSQVVHHTNSIYTIPKAPMESGTRFVTGNGFTNVVIGGKAPIAIEPVVVNPYGGAAPPGALFIATPDTLCARTCREMYAFLIADGKLTMARASTPPMSTSPLADTPKCKKCLETVGIFMSTSGVYYRGLIYFATGTAVRGHGPATPGVFWGELRPQFSRNTLVSAALMQHGTVGFSGGQGAFLPSVMADAQGNFFLLFDGGGSKLSPSVYVAARRPSDPPGVMSSMKLLRRGSGAPPVSWEGSYFPYGDYTAASYDPNSGVWFSSQYAKSSSVYGDYIVNVHL